MGWPQGQVDRNWGKPRAWGSLHLPAAPHLHLLAHTDFCLPHTSPALAQLL